MPRDRGNNVAVRLPRYPAGRGRKNKMAQDKDKVNNAAPLPSRRHFIVPKGGAQSKQTKGTRLPRYPARTFGMHFWLHRIKSDKRMASLLSRKGFLGGKVACGVRDRGGDAPAILQGEAGWGKVLRDKEARQKQRKLIPRGKQEVQRDPLDKKTKQIQRGWLFPAISRGIQGRLAIKHNQGVVDPGCDVGSS